MKHLFRLHKKTTAFMLTFIISFLSLTGICFAATDSGTTTYSFSDINLKVTIPNELICFTQSVTSNNSYLDLIGTNDVEELRSLMKINHIYLEAVPEDIAYELIISGKKAGSESDDFSTISDDKLKNLFNQYIEISDNISNDSVTEKVTSSYIERLGDVPYFVTDVTSVSNNEVTTYVKKYYTVMMGNSVTFFIQSNGQQINDEMSEILKSVVASAQYMTVKKSIFENEFFSEILATIITLAIPIAILALFVYITNKRKKKTPEQIAAEEERLRAEYARREQEARESENNK